MAARVLPPVNVAGTFITRSAKHEVAKQIGAALHRRAQSPIARHLLTIIYPAFVRHPIFSLIQTHTLLSSLPMDEARSDCTSHTVRPEIASCQHQSCWARNDPLLASLLGFVQTDEARLADALSGHEISLLSPPCPTATVPDAPDPPPLSGDDPLYDCGRSTDALEWTKEFWDRRAIALVDLKKRAVTIGQDNAVSLPIPAPAHSTRHHPPVPHNERILPLFGMLSQLHDETAASSDAQRFSGFLHIIRRKEFLEEMLRFQVSIPTKPAQAKLEMTRAQHLVSAESVIEKIASPPSTGGAISEKLHADHARADGTTVSLDPPSFHIADDAPEAKETVSLNMPVSVPRKTSWFSFLQISLPIHDTVPSSVEISIVMHARAIRGRTSTMPKFRSDAPLVLRPRMNRRMGDEFVFTRC